MDHLIDVPGHHAARDRADEAHQAVGLSKISVLNRLDDDQESIVNLVIDILHAELTAKVMANTPAENLIELLHRGRIAYADTLHERRPFDGLSDAGISLTVRRRGFVQINDLPPLDTIARSYLVHALFPSDEIARAPPPRTQVVIRSDCECSVSVIVVYLMQASLFSDEIIGGLSHTPVRVSLG
jgi:hypothetical protein